MDKLIIKHLNKTLKKLKWIKIYRDIYDIMDFHSLKERSKEILLFVTAKESSYNIYKDAFATYMTNEKNIYFKRALLNDIRLKLESAEKKDLIKFPDSLDRKSLFLFRKNVGQNLVANCAYLDTIEEIKNIGKPFEHLRYLNKYPEHQVEIALNLANYYIDLINAEIMIPYCNFHIEYTFDFSKNKAKMHQTDVKQYIDKWYNLEVTLSDWQQYPSINIEEYLSPYNLTADQEEEIRLLQYNLYNEQVNVIFNNRHRESFENLDFRNKKLIAERDLSLINLFINGDLNEANQKRVNKVLRIKDWEKTILHFEDILRGIYSSNNNHDIHHVDSHLYADIVIRYKVYLEKFLANGNNTKDISKKDKNLNDVTNKILAFKYNGPSEYLKHTLLALQDVKAISKDIKLPQFKKLFNGNEVTNPVPWHAAKGDLMVFLQTATKSPKFERCGVQIWNIAAKCFVKPNGLPYAPKEFKVKPTRNEVIFIKAACLLN